jgi:integrase
MAQRKNSRNANGTGSIRKKTVVRKGVTYAFWEARYTAGTNPGTGKPIRKSITGKTQKDVAERLKEATHALDDGTYIEPSKMTVSQWLETWIDECMADKKYGTVSVYKTQVNTHIKPSLGAIKLSELTSGDIQSFYNELSRNGHKSTKKVKGQTVVTYSPLSPKSVHNVHVILFNALATATARGLIIRNPCDLKANRISLPRNMSDEIHPLTDDEVKDFLKIVDTDEYGDLFKVLLFTGMRVSEALGLTWDDISFPLETIMLHKQLQKRPAADGGFVYVPLKNDKPRKVKPSDFVFQVLKERKVKQAEDRLKAGCLWEAWSNPKEQAKAAVFTNALGQHVSEKRVYIHFKKLAAQIGRPDARVHDLRHTYAVLSLQNGDDIKTLQGNLGHATAAFTLDRYGHVSDKMQSDSAERMQRYITQTIKQA